MKACFTHEPSKSIFSVKIGLFNPRSTRNKLTFILNAISTHSFDIFALTETWVQVNLDNVPKYHIFFLGYHVFHSCCSNGKRGGSISLIFSNSIKLTLVKSVTHSFFETLTAPASFPTQSLTISVFYGFPNSSNFICELTAHFYFLSLTFNHFIIVRFFNTPNCHDFDRYFW